MTWKNYHWALLAAGAAALAGLSYIGVKADRMTRIGTGYKAKIACSEIFLANRDRASVMDNEFDGIDPMMAQIRVSVDDDRKSVTAAGPFGLGRAHAKYREGYGCTLSNAGRLRALPAPEAIAATAPWPAAPPVSGQALFHVDYAAIDFALTRAFENNDANHRAIVVIVDGKLIDERYAEGFTSQTPFLSWSMAKSVTATLIGAAVEQGLINIDERAPVPEWSDDARGTITWNNLLHMQSGLEFREVYGDTRSDVNRMLFEMADSGALAAVRPAIHRPGAEWYYSSGTTNLLSKTLRQTLTSNGVNYHNFAQEAVFGPIGAASFTIEPDATGTFIGSSFVYATARDWARLGQLYLQDGVWNGVRILPQGWPAYVATPSGASDRQYGAHFWLNRDGAEGRARFLPGVPEETYYMAGHEGQYVIIIPDKRMIIVRTGMTRGRAAMPLVAPLIRELYEAVGNAPAQQ